MNFSKNCGFLSIAFYVIYTSFLDVDDALKLMAIVSLLIAGIFAMMYVPAAIAMQIMYGDVGIEPGCPTRCRSLLCRCTGYKQPDEVNSHRTTSLRMLRRVCGR